MKQVRQVDESLKPIQHDLEKLYEEINNYAGDGEEIRKLQGRLNQIDNKRVNGVFGGNGTTIPKGQAALHSLLHKCYYTLRYKVTQLEDADTEVDPSLVPIQKELEGILERLHKSTSGREIRRYQGMLDAVDNKRQNGIFGDSAALKGQAVLHDLLNEGYITVHKLLEKEENVDVAEELRPLYERLHSLLEEIEDYHGDEKGLKTLQGRVNELDNSRKNGVFGFKEGGAPPAGQTVLMNVLEACYSQIHLKHSLMSQKEAEVHPDLQHVKQELEGILKDLHAAKNNPTELPKIQGRLDAIDFNRRNGIFGNPQLIHPGQGVLSDLLNEAYELVHQIQSK